MFVNVIKSYRDTVAICDTELLGKKFEQEFEGNIRQLDVKENFYKGKETPEEEILEMLKAFSAEDATFNIVGEKSVQVALKAGIINEESVGRIQGIPFALVLI